MTPCIDCYRVGAVPKGSLSLLQLTAARPALDSNGFLTLPRCKPSVNLLLMEEILHHLKSLQS